MFGIFSLFNNYPIHGLVDAGDSDELKSLVNYGNVK